MPGAAGSPATLAVSQKLAGRAPGELGRLCLDLVMAAPADRRRLAARRSYRQLGAAAGIGGRHWVRQQRIDAPPAPGHRAEHISGIDSWHQASCQFLAARQHLYRRTIPL
jgi:hypothetical protein